MWDQEKRREYQREYGKRRYREDAEFRERKRKYYEENKRRIAFYNVEYRKKNAEKIKEYQTQYRKNKKLIANDTRGKEE